MRERIRALGRLRAAMMVLAIAPLTASGDAATAIVGGRFEYVVRAGDSWRSLGARFGVDAATLAELNARRTAARLAAGERLVIDNRHLVPEAPTDGLVLNIPQRMLFLRHDGRVSASYPVGLGRADWPTFVGPFTIAVMEKDPVWDVPPSIQEEMRRAGKPILTQVAPGPANPLGKYWLGLSTVNYGIHGTNAPLSIYRFETHGCIRLHNDDVADLWTRVTSGMPGQSVYEPVLVRIVEDALMLEAHPDVYRRATADALTLVERQAAAAGWSGGIDRTRAADVLRRRDGIPHRVDGDAP